MLTPITMPATRSCRVRPCSRFQNTSVPTSPAVTKRSPTKNSGPLCCMASWMMRKVLPQKAVTATSASSWRDSENGEGDCGDEGVGGDEGDAPDMAGCVLMPGMIRSVQG